MRRGGPLTTGFTGVLPLVYQGLYGADFAAQLEALHFLPCVAPRGRAFVASLRLRRAVQNGVGRRDGVPHADSRHRLAHGVGDAAGRHAAVVRVATPAAHGQA